MRKICIEFACVLFLIHCLSWTDILSATLDSTTYQFSNLSLKEGLSQLSVLEIYQDSKGYMWFGTRNGLNKYDGSRIKVYKHRNGDSLTINNNNITALIEDKDHQLWIGTSNGLNRLDLNKDEVTVIPQDRLLKSGVHSFLLDSRGRLWIGTSRGLKLYIREMDTFQTIDLDGVIKDEYVTCMCETSDNRLLIGTQHKGLFMCSMDVKVLERYSKESDKNHFLPDNNIATVYEDKEGCIWLGTHDSGVVHIDRRTMDIKTYSVGNSILMSNNIRCFSELDNVLFIGTFEGLYSINIDNKVLSAISTASINKGNLSHFSIYSLYIDKEKTLWVGTYAGGVNYFNKYSNRFSFYEPTEAINAYLGVCGAMVCKDSNTLYIATEGAGLLEYNLSSNKFRYYLYNTSEKQAYSKNIIKSITLDGDIIWCGTAMGDIYQFDTRTKKFKLKYKLSQNISIYAIHPDQDNTLWVATSKSDLGLIKIAENGEFKTEFEVKGEDVPWKLSSLRCLCWLKNGDILLGSRNNGLFKYRKTTRERTVYNAQKLGNNHLESNYITSIIQTKSDKVWISTYGGGIMQLDEELSVIKTITAKEGLAGNDVCALVEDQCGNLWMSVGSYISMYNPEKGEIYNFKQVASTGVQEFTPHSGTLLLNGNICFGANNGFVIFNPKDIFLSKNQSPLVFTDLKVNDVLSVPGKSTILSNTLDDTSEIELNYDQNNLSIGYCALNYIYPEYNQYAFRLKGYDDGWRNVGNRHEAYYTNLNPGKYVFEVKYSNSDGIWSEHIRTLHIVIKPPFWRTWYAYIFYLIVFFGICFVIMYYILKKRMLEQALYYKQLEQKQNEEFHQQKIRMFTNFSHELRTPLTLIISPLQELLQKAEFESSIRNKLSLIYNNSQRLLLLVNQLMDLRKNQSGKMRLRIAKEDISSFVKEMYCAFNQLAVNKNIELIYKCSEECIPAWFDKTLFEKVIFNLLSNAFKYTPEGGQIEIELRKLQWKELDKTCQKEFEAMPGNTSFIHLIISDTGIGIPENEMKNIFAPFYQIDDKQTKNLVGTGIGLSLTYSIVQLHYGIIWAQNRMQGGTEFHVVFPIDRTIYKEEEIDADAVDRVVLDVIPSDSAKGITIEMERKFNLLLVEDNDEVRTYVKECLSPYFNVEEAENGEIAYEKVLKIYPDLVLCDIMMPKKNGLELCSMIKNDIQTEHIPVILMTARSMVVHIKEGFSCGADDYIVKPFNIDVLIYRIKSLLESREKLKKIYGKKFTPEALGMQIASNNDRFTQKFFSIIEHNISNPELNIDMICKEIGLSRSNLYRKLKAITELSPVELIRNKRLEIAAKLLIDSDYSVAEVSDLVGFNGHTYFSQCFKSLYGLSPTEFVRMHRKNNL